MVDAGHKATTILKCDKYTDYYGMQWESKAIMQLNHDEKGNSEAFIAAEFRDKNDVRHGFVCDIEFCPFCGALLARRK